MTAPTPHSAVYEGVVWHARALTPAHAFRGRLAMLLLDLDELPALARTTSLLGADRKRPIELRTRDHFRGRSRDLRTRLAATLSTRGLPPPDGPVRVLTQCRVLGQGFNPVSFWWAYDGHGELLACVAEVNNTFGDRHPYVLPAAEAERTPVGRAWTVRKRMHVSPFMDLSGSYRFELSEPAESLTVRATLEHGDEVRLRAGFDAGRTPLSDRALLGAFARWPGMPWQVWTSIHAQAVALWRKGARYHRRPRYAPSRLEEPAHVSGGVA